MAQSGVEGGWQAHEVTSVLYTHELGPSRTPVTLIPEGQEEVDPSVLESVRPTGYVLPHSSVSSLERAMEPDQAELLPFSNSLARAAHREGNPVYLIGGRVPELLRNMDLSAVRKVSILPDILALSSFAMVVGHVLTSPEPRTLTRRRLLAGGAIGTLALAVYTAFGPNQNEAKVEDIAARLASYTEEEQQLMLNWYRVLRGFSNLVIASKMHEVARFHADAAGTHLLALAPAQNEGLQAAMALSPEERDTMILQLVNDVIVPLQQQGVLSQDDFIRLLDDMSHFIEARPVHGREGLRWEDQLHPVITFAEVPQEG